MIAAGKTAGITHHQLGQRGAVHTASLFLQHFQDKGVGVALTAKYSRKPGFRKKPVQTAGFSECLFHRKYGKSGVGFCNFFNLFLRHKGLFRHSTGLHPFYWQTCRFLRSDRKCSGFLSIPNHTGFDPICQYFRGYSCKFTGRNPRVYPKICMNSR